MSNNSLTSLEGLHESRTLKWVSAANNQVTSLRDVEGLTQLQARSMASSPGLIEHIEAAHHLQSCVEMTVHSIQRQAAWAVGRQDLSRAGMQAPSVLQEVAVRDAYAA